MFYRHLGIFMQSNKSYSFSRIGIINVHYQQLIDSKNVFLSFVSNIMSKKQDLFT